MRWMEQLAPFLNLVREATLLRSHSAEARASDYFPCTENSKHPRSLKLIQMGQQEDSLDNFQGLRWRFQDLRIQKGQQQTEANY